MPDQNTDPLLASEADISARLKPVCSEWPEELFMALVQQIARISQKYNHATAPPLPDPHVTATMIAEMKALADRGAEIRGVTELPGQ